MPLRSTIGLSCTCVNISGKKKHERQGLSAEQPESGAEKSAGRFGNHELRQGFSQQTHIGLQGRRAPSRAAWNGRPAKSAQSPVPHWAAYRCEVRSESADKPGSVVDNHSSGTAVTSSLKRPTRKPAGRRCLPCGTLLPYLVLLRVGFTYAAACCHPRGALLPHLFTLTAGLATLRRLFSVALSVGSRLPGVTWHPARRSPDFPPACEHASDCLADSPGHLRAAREDGKAPARPTGLGWRLRPSGLVRPGPPAPTAGRPGQPVGVAPRCAGDARREARRLGGGQLCGKDCTMRASSLVATAARSDCRPRRAACIRPRSPPGSASTAVRTSASVPR